ncbi:hypothetical protein DSCW_22290 [Desulfosarcina widdelii]|uniref:Outer membrane protein beta-barrel domain-containing protein n=1 Tax=Desulfosarcina widdelii TaxID=947919 RepID=A0A5K7YYQ1_9BACT|nr:hypothetical protein [Desulfosarcina widdelii]BBO74812.1 hypothetical protein DSCW_22290 [Desulfosarcina widdelii]
MKSLVRRCLILILVGVQLLAVHAAMASDSNLQENPWKKFSVDVGVFLTAVDSSVRLGTGLGVDVDVEEALGLESTNTVFRADALWRFTQNQRHRLDFTWFSFRRNGNRQITEDVAIEDDDGNRITILAETGVEAFFDLDIYELAYTYSFFQDDRIDLAAGIGFYVMPIDFGIKSRGLLDEEGQENFTAPLPVFGLRMDVALNPRWFIRTGAQVFYVEIDNFKGSIMEFRTALEYNPWTHVGIGLGFDTLGIRLEAEDEDWPGIDLKGNVEFNYAGLQLYLRLFF